MPTIKDLLELRASSWEEMKALNDEVDKRDGKYTAEEKQKDERLQGEYDGLTERIERKQSLEKTEAEIRAKTGGRDVPGPDARTAPSLDKQIRGLIGRPGAFVDFGMPEERQYPILNSAADARAWSEQRADMAKGASATGGYIVAEPTFMNLVELLYEMSPLLSAGVTILTTSKGEQLTIPKVSSAGATNLEVAEAGSGDGTEPTFAAPARLDAYKYMQTVLVSNELIEDAMIDIGAFVLKQIAFNVSHGTASNPGFGSRIVVGSGSSQPNGIITASTVGVTGATSTVGVPTMDNLIDLQYSVAMPYAARGVWLMKRATAGFVRKLKDSTNNYIWQTSVQAGTPDTLLGDRVYQDPFVAGTGLSAKSVLYGDVSAYWVRLVGSLRLEMDTSVQFLTDQTAFKATLRGDGDLIDTNATRIFVGGAS
jgi:HK97 family phage major capsid protein